MINQKRIYKHKRDIKIGDKKNAFVKHNLETNHKFNFKDSKTLVNIHIKKAQIVEFYIISNYITVK